MGDDPFGKFIEETFKENGVDTSRLLIDPSARTTLAFVSLKAGGVPDFAFFRNPGADMLLKTSELDESFIQNARIFHYAGISLTEEPARSATLAGADIAQEDGLITSYDPNLRLSLWDSPESAKRGIAEGLTGASIVKLNEEELHFLVGETPDLPTAVQALLKKSGSIALVFVTRGPKGCHYATRKVSGDVSGFDVTPLDTTGAGDAFMGAVLYQLIEHKANIDSIGDLSKSELDSIAKFANAVGAISVTRRGAISSLPTRSEVEAFLAGGRPQITTETREFQSETRKEFVPTVFTAEDEFEEPEIQAFHAPEIIEEPEAASQDLQAYLTQNIVPNEKPAFPMDDEFEESTLVQPEIQAFRAPEIIEEPEAASQDLQAYLAQSAVPNEKPTFPMLDEYEDEPEKKSPALPIQADEAPIEPAITAEDDQAALQEYLAQNLVEEQPVQTDNEDVETETTSQEDQDALWAYLNQNKLEDADADLQAYLKQNTNDHPEA